MFKKILIIAGLVVAAVCAIVGGLYYNDNKRENFSEGCVLYVYPDMTADQVRDSLQSIVLRPRSLERAFKKIEVSEKIKPGRYVVEPSFTSIYVARMLIFGWQTPQNMTLSGTIRRKGVLAKKISSQMMVDSASVAQALDSAAFLAGYGFTPENVFAMILPDTYQMYWTASVKEIFDRFKKE